MRCHQVRELVGPYLDSELDTKTSHEIAQHLESCADCARVLEVEGTLDKQIFSALRKGDKNDSLWRDVEAQVAAPRLSQRWWRSRPVVVAAFATACAVALIAVLVWPAIRSLDLAKAIEQDHREFLAGKFGPDFKGTPPESVTRDFGERLDNEAFSAVPSLPGVRTEGSRLCHLSGVPAAWTLVRVEDVPVSLIVMKRSELEHFPNAAQRLAAGELVVCKRMGRFQFAARLVGEHVVCALGEISKSRLENLVLSVRRPG